MGRFHQLLALILLLAVTASGQVVTTDAGALTSRVWGATVNAPWYLRTIVVQGATPLDLTDRYVSFTVRQMDTEALVHSATGTIHVVNPGEVIFTWTPRAPGTFAAAAVIRRTDTGETVANIMDDTITVTNPPGAGAAQVSVISSNVVDLGNLTVQWEIQGDGDLAPDSTDRNIVPHTDLGSSIGKTNERFAEAHINEGYFGTIRAGTVDVESAVGFLDNTKVKLTGETNAVDLTNAEVRVRTPINPPDAVNKGYVDAVAGGTTNIGSVQFYTNAAGQVGRYTASGYFITLQEEALPTTDWTTFYSFDDPSELASWSNLNVTGSAWTYYVTNGALHIVGPSESSSSRHFGLIPITSGVASRCAMRIREPLTYPIWVNGNYGYGLSAYDSGLTNTAFHARRANTAGEVLETYIFNRSFSESQDTRYIAPYTAGSLSTAYTYLWGWHGITMYGDFDGVKTLRFYLSNSPNEAPALQYRTTNSAVIIGWNIMAQCSSAAAGATNSGPFIIDWYGAKTGDLWQVAW